MGARSLMQRIIDLLDAASGPLTAGDIRRRLVGDIRHDEVTSRLAILKKRGRVVVEEVPSQAITGPRVINAYSLVREDDLLKLVTNIAENGEKGEIASREVASTGYAASPEA